jgi:beta-N-acetylhexosaminidase
VLRQQMEFDGIIFSDDLSMSGAESVGGYPERARHALAAGCDILLVCNNLAGADEVLESLQGYSNPTSQLRMIRLHGQVANANLFESRAWQNACAELHAFNQRLGLAESGDLFE